MIINRYIVRTIHLGTLGALLALVGLGLFFLFVGELKDLGEGSYDFLNIVKFVALSVPGKIVEFMPLAVLLGSILSLGALASNSEIIALQASGVSLSRLITPILQAAVLLAMISFFLAEWIVPDSETSARAVKNLAQDKTTALLAKQSVWIKDESRVLHIDSLLPNGGAHNIEIFELDDDGNLLSTIKAERAIPHAQGWELSRVQQSIVGDQTIETKTYERLLYEGNLSHQLLEVLSIKPRQMSTVDLYAYLSFLDENKLDASSERLVFWQKILAPLTIVVMCLLALPFVIGAQRQGNAGQRLLIGILLGLAFVVMERLLTQLGVQFGLNALFIAATPGLVFLCLALYLLLGKQSHGFAGKLLFSRAQS